MKNPFALTRTMAVPVALSMLLAGTPVVAAAAEEETEAPGVIRGTLIDANGQPLAGYRVKVTDASGSVFESEPTGEDGKYEITDLPQGTYTYMILDPEGKTVSVRIPPVSLQAGTIVTQPIAIVPRRTGRGPLIAWLVGGGAAAVALALAGSSDGGDETDDRSMTPGGGS